jgi:N-acetyl-alpha-D-glucosaminyl L-malate synthase BshA
MSGSGEAIRVGFVLHVMQVAGAEVLVSEIIGRLGTRIQPVIFCLDSVGALGERLQAQGVDVVTLDRRPGLDFGVARRMAAEIRRRNVEILHAHQYTPFFYAAFARVLCGGGPRLIFTEHGRHYPDVVSSRRRLTNRWLLGHLVDEVTAVSEFSARSLAELDGFTGRDIHVIENGIDLERYVVETDRPAVRKRLGLQPARRYVANIARFHPVKDQATLLRAFAEVARQRQDTDLLLVGDGPLRSSLEQLARSLGIGDRVRFLGVRHDVPLILRAVDVFVLTSVSEAASITLLEAMASGVPAVVTAVGGNPEMIHHNVEGLLVPRGDPQATAVAIGQLLDDPEKAATMGAAGVRRVREQYQLSATIEHYYKLFCRLADRS